MTNEKRLQALAELQADGHFADKQSDGERMELKPCPFCGYWAMGFYDDNSDYESHHNYGVSCQAWLDKQSPKCGVSISGYKTKGEAYTAWNTRHSEQAGFNKGAELERERVLDLVMEELSKAESNNFDYHELKTLIGKLMGKKAGLDNVSQV